MAIIKFDSEKADALIKDLNRISSDLDSNFTRVYNNSFGKEISLTDSKLKVYAYRNKTVEVQQEDGTIVEEVEKEKYLKHDFVANARLFNKHVRNIYNRSNSAKTKATKSIAEVINSLNKIKALISEYESEHSLKLSNSLDDAGQFDFNFLAAYGPMGRPQNYSHSFGTIVADDAYTSLHLGVLGKRPTSINLEKLEIFDNMLKIAKNKELTAKEQMRQVHDLLMENVLDVDPEGLNQKVMMAYESMKKIAESKDVVIDESLKIESLVKLGIPVIVDYDGDLAINIKNADGAAAQAAVAGLLFMDRAKPGENKAESGEAVVAGKLSNMLGTVGKNAGGGRKPLRSQIGIDTDVELSAEDAGKKLGAFASNAHGKLNQFGKEGFKQNARDKEIGSNIGDLVKPKGDGPKPDLPKMKDKLEDLKNRGPKNPGSPDIPKKEAIHNIQKPQNGDIKEISTPKLEVDKEVIEKPVLKDEIKLSSEDIAIDREIQSVKIENNYREIEAKESSNNTSVNVEIDDSVERKGSGVLAGAAGLGALSKMVGNSSPSVPQVNGMAAGELLGINTGSDPASMGLVVGNMPGASASTGNVTAPTSTNSTVGGESTSDRGTVNNASKSNNASTSGRGGSTLEDKDDKKDENSYGKPNKPEETEENTKKGLLGDASIAELDAKDEKEMKVATGVTAVTAVTSGVLALFNVFPWLMLIIALIAIGSYIGYRIKKKKDKEKRLAALNALKAQEAANATITMEAVQNVNDTIEQVSVETVQESVPAVQESVPIIQAQDTTTNEEEVMVQEVRTGNDEFSEQPYEPSRDGMTEIGGQSTNNLK